MGSGTKRAYVGSIAQPKFMGTGSPTIFCRACRDKRPSHDKAKSRRAHKTFLCDIPHSGWKEFTLLNSKLNFLISTAPTVRRLISTFECIARSVGFPLRPGHVAYGDGLNASTYPPDRAMHLIYLTTIFIVRRIGGSDRRLRRCRRARATRPGIGVMPTAYPTHTNVVLSRRSFSCSNRILGQNFGVRPREAQ